jgi:2-desacetyl-2-hydroxyethyl bacteriochlorophyllide A dehydrogenase
VTWCGICGTDLEEYVAGPAIIPVEVPNGLTGRVAPITLGHEFVGQVAALGPGVTEFAVGERVAREVVLFCGQCFFCRRGVFQKCDEGRVFGHGAVLGSLQGTQAEMALVPHANLTLRRVPEGLSDGAALFAGDVMGTGYHSVVAAGLSAGDTVAVVGLGPVGLCAVMAARAGGAAHVIAVDTVEDRLALARSMGAEAVHATEEDPRTAVKAATGGRGVDIAVDAVGNPKALEACCRFARKAGTVSVTGVYAERVEVHMGILWLKSLNLVSGHANVMGHLDKVLALLASGALDVEPLLSREMKLDDAAEAYEAYDRREALKIVLRA